MDATVDCITIEAMPDVDLPAGPASDHSGDPGDLAYRASYDVMGLRAEVRSNSAEAIQLLNRLNALFIEATQRRPDAEGSTNRVPDALYEVVSHDHGTVWEISREDEELGFRDSAARAASHVEWHLCNDAIARRQDLLHVHGAALCNKSASVLLPGGSGIGKTTFALALALKGLRLLSDDVVFLHTATWQPAAFPRAFHIHDDALPRLAPLGLQWSAEDHIGAHLCSTVLGPWDRQPGPPLRYVIFPQLNPHGPIQLAPISNAEATLELMRYSKNLRSFPRHGLDLIPQLLQGAQCFFLRRNDDLAGAAAVLIDLLRTGEPPDEGTSQQ